MLFVKCIKDCQKLQIAASGIKMTKLSCNFSSDKDSEMPSESEKNVLDKWQTIKAEERKRLYGSDKFFHPDNNHEFTSESLNFSLGKEAVSKEPNAFGLIYGLCKAEFLEPSESDIRAEEYLNKAFLQRHSPFYYARRMEELVAKKKIKEALYIFDHEMMRVNAKPDVYCYSVVINGCSKVGFTRKAFQLYNQMKKRGYKPIPHIHTSLFNACSNSPWPLTDGLERATKLYDKLKADGEMLNSITYQAIIKAFGHCQDVATAFGVVDEMIKRDVQVTTETINFLLQSCISDKKAGFRHAVFVWQKMLQLNLKPDLYSFNLLARCTKECMAGCAVDNFRSITKAELNAVPAVCSNVTQPLYLNNTKVKDDIDSTLFPLLFRNYIDESNHVEARWATSVLTYATDRLSSLNGAVGFFMAMKAFDVKPDLKTFTLLLDCLSDTQAEDKLLQIMQTYEMVPDVTFCNILMRKRARRCDLKAAKDVFVLMQDHSLSPNILTFGCLSVGCFRLHDAQDLLSSMKNSGFRPGVEIFTNLLKCSRNSSTFYYAAAIIRYMKDAEVVPDERLLLLLEEIRSEARKVIIEFDDKPMDCHCKFELNKYNTACNFLKLYNNWLKKSPVQLEQDPWKQYMSAKDDFTEEEVFQLLKRKR